MFLFCTQCGRDTNKSELLLNVQTNPILTSSKSFLSWDVLKQQQRSQLHFNTALAFKHQIENELEWLLHCVQKRCTLCGGFAPDAMPQSGALSLFSAFSPPDGALGFSAIPSLWSAPSTTSHTINNLASDAVAADHPSFVRIQDRFLSETSVTEILPLQEACTCCALQTNSACQRGILFGAASWPRGLVCGKRMWSTFKSDHFQSDSRSFSSYFDAFECVSSDRTEVSVETALKWAFSQHSKSIFNRMRLPTSFEINAFVETSSLRAILRITWGPGSKALVVSVPFPSQSSPVFSLTELSFVSDKSRKETKEDAFFTEFPLVDSSETPEKLGLPCVQQHLCRTLSLPFIRQQQLSHLRFNAALLLSDNITDALEVFIRDVANVTSSDVASVNLASNMTLSKRSWKLADSLFDSQTALSLLLQPSRVQSTYFPAVQLGHDPLPPVSCLEAVQWSFLQQHLPSRLTKLYIRNDLKIRADVDFAEGLAVLSVESVSSDSSSTFSRVPVRIPPQLVTQDLVQHTISFVADIIVSAKAKSLSRFPRFSRTFSKCFICEIINIYI
jgi:hypothetical protein